VSKILAATLIQESPQTVTVELREQVGNLQIGWLEVTLVPEGVRIDGWHGKDESQHDGQMVLRSERP